MRTSKLVTLGTAAFVLLFVGAVGVLAYLFISVGRKAALQPPWAERYRLRDPLPPGMVQDRGAASRNRNFGESFKTAKDRVLSYVFGTSTVAHVGPGSSCEMFPEGEGGGVLLELERGSAYVQDGDVLVRVKARGLTVTPHQSRHLVVVEGKDLLVYCFYGEPVVELGLGTNPWSYTLKEGKSYRFPDKSFTTPVEGHIPAEAVALDAALELRLAPEAPED